MVNLAGMDKAGFAARFKEAVEQAGVEDSQEALGRLLGVSGVMIWAYRSGEKLPRMSTATRMADKLGVNVNWLLTGKGPRNPEKPGVAERGPHTYYIPDAPDILQRLPIVPWERVSEWLARPFDTEYSVPIWRRPGTPAARPYSDKAFALMVDGEQYLPELPVGSVLLVDTSATKTHKSWAVVKLSDQGRPSLWQAIPSIDPSKPHLRSIMAGNGPAEAFPAGARLIGHVVSVVMPT